MFKFLMLFICIISLHAIYNLINFFRYNSIKKLFLGMSSKDTDVYEKKYFF